MANTNETFEQNVKSIPIDNTIHNTRLFLKDGEEVFSKNPEELAQLNLFDINKQSVSVTSKGTIRRSNMRMTLDARRALEESLPLISYEIPGMYTFSFKAIKKHILKFPTVPQFELAVNTVFKHTYKESFSYYDPKFMDQIFDYGSELDVLFLYNIYYQIHKQYAKIIASRKADTKTFKQAIAQADRHRTLLSLFDTKFVFKSTLAELEQFKLMNLILLQYAYDIESFQAGSKKYFIANHGNFIKAVHSLNLHPIIVEKHSPLMVAVLGYLYRVPTCVPPNKLLEIMDDDEIKITKINYFKKLVVQWNIFLPFSTVTKQNDWYKLYMTAFNKVMEIHWPTQGVSITQPDYVAYAKFRLDAETQQKKILFGTYIVKDELPKINISKPKPKNKPIDTAKYTAELHEYIQFAGFMAHIVNLSKNLHNVSSPMQLATTLINSTMLFAVNKKFAQALSTLLQSPSHIRGYVQFVSEMLKSFYSYIKSKTTRKTKPQQTTSTPPKPNIASFNPPKGFDSLDPEVKRAVIEMCINGDIETNSEYSETSFENDSDELKAEALWKYKIEDMPLSDDIAELVENRKPISLTIPSIRGEDEEKSDIPTSEVKSDVTILSSDTDGKLQTIIDDEAEYTSWQEVFAALKNSDFAEQTNALLASLKFSLIINSLFDWLMPDGLYKIILTSFVDILKNIDSFANLQSIFDTLLSEVIPAIISGDASLIKPSKFKVKIRIIEKAIVLAGNNDDVEIHRVIEEWYEQPVEIHNLYLQFENAILDMTTFIHKFNNDKSPVIHSIIKSLALAQIVISAQAKHGVTRKQPFCVGIWGEAGVGKTTLIPKISLWLARSCGITLQRNDQGHLVPPPQVPIVDTSKFCDNVNNGTQILVFDDLGITAENRVAPGTNAYTTFMQVQANVATPIPRSDLASKKNQFFNNKLTFVTSNHRNFGADFQVTEQTAFRRRITVNIKFSLEDPNDHLSRYYELTIYDDETRKFKTEVIRFDDPDMVARSIKTDEKLRDFLIEQSEDYHEKRDNYLRQARGNYLCSVCNKVHYHVNNHLYKESCTCANHNLALWIEPNQLEAVMEIDPKLIAFTMISEELISHHIYDYLLSINNSYSSMIFFALCVFALREYIEFSHNKSFQIPRMIINFACTCFPLYLAIALHFMFNISYFFKSIQRTAPIFQRVGRFIGTFERTFVNLECSLVGIDATAKSLANKVDYYELLLNEAWTRIGKYLQIAIPTIAGMAAAKMIYDSYVKKNVSIFTALGEEPSIKDQKSTLKLNEIVGGVNDINEIDITGCTQNFRTNFEPVIRRSNGTIPRTVSSNDIMITFCKTENNKTTAAITHATYSHGFIYSCAHGLGPRKYIEDGNTVTASFYFVNKPLEVFYYTFNKDGAWRRGLNDTLSFPFTSSSQTSITRRSQPIFMDFKPKANDKFMISDSQNLVSITHMMPESQMQDSDGSVEPAGDYALDVLTTYGESGKAIYLVKRDGESVIPTLVGVISRISQTLNRTVMAPFKFPSTSVYTNLLTSQVDESVVVDYFNSVGYTIDKNIHKNSILKHIDDISQIGYFVGHTVIPSYASPSQFYKTEFYEQSLKMFPNNVNLCIPSLQHRVENGTYKHNMLSCFRQMACTGQIKDEAVFHSAAKLLTEYLLSKLDLSPWKPISPTLVLKGTQRTNPINLKSSVGFPHAGLLKSDIVVGSHEEPMLTEEFTREIIDIYEKLDNNVPIINIAKAAIKDEIITKKKDNLAQARVYFAGNFSFLYVCRQQLSLLMEIFVASRDKIFPKIGLNAIGPEFDEFLRNIYKSMYPEDDDDKDIFTNPCWVDGDFSKYDKTLLVYKYAIQVVWQLAQNAPHFKNNPRDMNRLRGCLEGFLHYIVILEGHIFILDDKMPSGVWATSLFNCIAEMILEILQYFFLIHYYNTKSDKIIDFVAYYCKTHNCFTTIAVANYGDDNIKCVSKLYLKYYNHKAIMEFAKFIRMGITPARKHEVELGCKPITDIMFLKRVPVFNEYLNRFVGRLEFDSIGKMLAFTDSKAPEWRRNILMAARRELAFHSQDLYDQFFILFNVDYIPIEQTLSEIEKVDWSTTQTFELPIWLD